MIDHFCLDDEPWIAAVDSNGAIGAYSMRGVFRQAGNLTALAGEGPTQDAAVLRLLVAILYRALPVKKEQDARIDAWQGWWEADTLPLDQIEAYLDRYHERFDLLGDEPFMQVATLNAKGTSGLRKLIADVPPNEQYFTTRSGRALDRIALDEAARWTVHAQAFDPSGIKTGAIGDPTVKGGKGYPIGTGWSGCCGLVLLEGRTLRETLLLNLVLSIRSGPEDTPVWERGALGPAPSEHTQPGGPADLLTWPARRIRLIRDEDAVTDVLLCNGDRLEQQNRQRVEPHCGWRYSEPQTKKLGETVYMPRTHDPDRALWRGLPTLLVEGSGARGRGDGPQPAQAPAVLEWLAQLVRHGVLPRDHGVSMRGVGIEYGAQSSTIAAIVDDSVALSASVVADPRLRVLVVEAADDAEAAVRGLATFAANLCRAAGVHEVDGARSAARQQAYAALDAGYRRWLASLRSDSDHEERRLAWQSYVVAQLRQLADQLVAAAGEPARRGREVKTPTTSYALLDAGLARLWFDAAMYKALPAWASASSTSIAAQEVS